MAIKGAAIVTVSSKHFVALIIITIFAIKMNTPIIPAALGLLVLCSIQFVESLPINKRMSGSITTPSDVVNMSRSIWSRLIDKEATSEGLFPVFIKATYLTQSDIFKPEVRCICTHA